MSRESIANALREYRLKSGLSASEIARAVGKSEKTIYAWEKCNGQPDADTLIILSKLYGIDSFQAFENVESARREGAFWSRPLVAAYVSAASVTQRNVCKLLDLPHIEPDSVANVNVVHFAPKRMMKMQVYTDVAAAGIPIYAESDFEFLDFEEDEIPTGADFGIRIAGDSMEPTIEDGSIVWIHRQPDIHNGNIGVFMLDGGDAVCKRARCASDGRLIALESDNRKYSPIKGETLNEVRLVGRVLI